MSASHEHLHHPNADKSVTFNGLGAYEKAGDVKPLSYNPPKLADNFVDIEISHCGICGSDIHTIDSGWGPTTYPVIVGHEIIGKVLAVGSAVKHVKVGDRVGVGAQCGACMKCYECGQRCENHCSKDLIWTYNSAYPDGQVSMGGYADRVRCQADFAFQIPDAISSADAAPLMCAGVTVFAPLARYVTRPGMTVGVIGIGGLGHLAVMFAAKMHGGNTHVTAISHNSKKKAEALAMGAKDFLDTSDKAAMAASSRKFDVIITTTNIQTQLSDWLALVKLKGTFCTVGLPEENVNFNLFSLLMAEVNYTASGIGSVDEINAMLKFAADHNVRPIIERFPMEKANEGIKRVRDGTVRFRVVLENPTK